MDVDTSLMEPSLFPRISDSSGTVDASTGMFAMPHQPVWTDKALARFVDEIFDTTAFPLPPIPQAPLNGSQDFSMLA